MTRNLKALGLALVAMFAMSAFAASAASATEFTSSGDVYPVSYSGTQPASEPHVFSADGNNVSCKVAEFSGEQTAKSTTATVFPTYKECTVGSIEATIHMNGCDYLFHLPSAGNNATVDIVCPKVNNVTQEITITAGTCVIHVPEQNGLSHVNMSNNSGHIAAKPTLSNITSNLTDGFLCPFEGNTHNATGTLTGGAVTLIGSRSIHVG